MRHINEPSEPSEPSRWQAVQPEERPGWTEKWNDWATCREIQNETERSERG